MSPLFIFSWKTDDLFLLISVTFYFLLISLGCHPLEGVIRGGPPPLPSDATGAVCQVANFHFALIPLFSPHPYLTSTSLLFLTPRSGAAFKGLILPQTASEIGSRTICDPQSGSGANTRTPTWQKFRTLSFSSEKYAPSDENGGDNRYIGRRYNWKLNGSKCGCHPLDAGEMAGLALVFPMHMYTISATVSISTCAINYHTEGSLRSSLSPCCRRNDACTNINK